MNQGRVSLAMHRSLDKHRAMLKGICSSISVVLQPC